jgi:oxygen-independent coproporphyrinogen-3 oxidase
LPNQTKETWKNNLEIAVALPIKHISTYSLILERGTILNKMVLDGKVKMNSENYDAELYEYTMNFLEKNYFNQYEISNFAKDGYECKHNLYYWQYKDYLSFGTSSHSFANGKRWWNYSSLKQYIAEIKKSGVAVRGEEILTENQMVDEIVMLGLRSNGLILDELKKYSSNWYFEKKNIINSFINESYLEEKNGILRCTKKGYMICDELINKLI